MKMKAVVFVDVQKDFIDGAIKNEKAIEVLPKIVEFAKECVANGYKLYATRDTHDKGYLNTLEGKKLPVEHCVEGTEGWMIDEQLFNVIDGNVTIINKPTFGSFDLAEIILEDFFEGCQHIERPYCSINHPLKMKEKLDEIILVGYCTDICVAANAILLRAKFPDIEIAVRKDLCAGVTPETHEAALRTLEMQQIAVTDADANTIAL